VKQFYYNLKVSYLEMFVFHLRKEHKLIGLLYNLHIEYSKVEMVTFLYLYLLISLLFVTCGVAWFDTDGV
jgi:hypothetical protein